MIHVDSREGGSKQITEVPKIVATLKSHRFHPPVTVAKLPAGDFFFTGNGPNGEAVSIGFERKRISDFFSSLHSGRLVAEQIPKLLDLYEYRYLIVEGQAKVDWATGELMEMQHGQWVPVSEKAGRNKQIPYTGQEMLGAMNTISTFTPIILIRTFGLHDTLDVVTTLWHWWDKKWDAHHTLNKFHTPQDTVSIGKASFVRRVAAQLEKVGWEKSGIIEGHFKSVRDMCEASPKEWERLPGIGPVLSSRIVKELKGER